MINDLRDSDVYVWKYVDDTTIAKIVPKKGRGNIQNAVDAVQHWSHEQNMQLNADKCKEFTVTNVLRLSFDSNDKTVKPLSLSEVSSLTGGRLGVGWLQ